MHLNKSWYSPYQWAHLCLHYSAFAALKADGSITSWGNLDNFWTVPINKTTNAPTDKGYTKIYSNAYAFSAVKPDATP
jgi:hypothetical protein